METKGLEHILGVGEQGFQLVVAGPGFDELDHLHLVELVHADKSPRVLAVASGLAAETGRVGGEVDRQIAAVQYFFAVKVGHRHLGGGDKEEIVRFHPVHVLFHFGKLAGAGHAVAVNQERREDLAVSVAADMKVNHPGDKRPFEKRSDAGKNHEPAAGEFRRPFHVQYAQGFP